MIYTLKHEICKSDYLAYLLYVDLWNNNSGRLGTMIPWWVYLLYDRPTWRTQCGGTGTNKFLSHFTLYRLHENYIQMSFLPAASQET